jgi:hypothetical protein
MFENNTLVVVSKTIASSSLLYPSDKATGEEDDIIALSLTLDDFVFALKTTKS